MIDYQARLSQLMGDSGLGITDLMHRTSIRRSTLDQLCGNATRKTKVPQIKTRNDLANAFGLSLDEFDSETYVPPRLGPQIAAALALAPRSAVEVSIQLPLDAYDTLTAVAMIEYSVLEVVLMQAIAPWVAETATRTDVQLLIEQARASRLLGSSEKGPTV